MSKKESPDDRSKNERLDDRDPPPTADDAPAPDAPPSPPIQEFPKMLYHADGRRQTVASKAEETAATKDGFKAQPGTEDRAKKAPTP